MSIIFSFRSWKDGLPCGPRKPLAAGLASSMVMVAGGVGGAAARLAIWACRWRNSSTVAETHVDVRNDLMWSAVLLPVHRTSELQVGRVRSILYTVLHVSYAMGPTSSGFPSRVLTSFPSRSWV